MKVKNVSDYIRERLGELDYNKIEREAMAECERLKLITKIEEQAYGPINYGTDQEESG